MRSKTPNTKHQTPDFNLQIPNSKHQGNTNLQIPDQDFSVGVSGAAVGTLVTKGDDLGFGIWCLVFGTYLVFGVWCFVFFGINDASAQDTNPQAKPAEKLLYENNFEKAEIGKVPDEFVVLDGAFAVKEESGNKFLELPGAPLGEGSGVIFGPTADPKEGGGMVVSARIQGTGKGRRYPAFAIGAFGQGGWKLQLSPGKKLLELCQGTEMITNVPFAWESDYWTVLRLQVRKVNDGGWKIEGKAWKQGTSEPAAWPISHDAQAEPPSGRASIWGSPYSGTPIRFDDLRVAAVQ